MSKPRAATSVATSTRSSPDLNWLSTSSRVCCDLSPWMALADSPRRTKSRDTWSADCLVLQNTMTWFMFKSTISRSNSSRLRWLSMEMTCSSTLALVVFCAATSTICGAFIKSCASLRISGAKVAENSSVWRGLGSICMMVRMSSIKPMSSMRSASSSTTISTLLKLMFFCLTWSSSRPTVAMTISQPARKSAVCLFMFTPPNSTVWRRGIFLM